VASIVIGPDGEEIKKGSNTDTFHQLPQVEHKFIPQYKGEALTLRDGAAQ